MARAGTGWMLDGVGSRDGHDILPPELFSRQNLKSLQQPCWFLAVSYFPNLSNLLYYVNREEGWSISVVSHASMIHVVFHLPWTIWCRIWGWLGTFGKLKNGRKRTSRCWDFRASSLHRGVRWFALDVLGLVQFVIWGVHIDIALTEWIRLWMSNVFSSRRSWTKMSECISSYPSHTITVYVIKNIFIDIQYPTISHIFIHDFQFGMLSSSFGDICFTLERSGSSVWIICMCKPSRCGCWWAVVIRKMMPIEDGKRCKDGLTYV